MSNKSAKWIKGAFIKCRCGEVADGIIHCEDDRNGQTISKKVIGINCNACELKIEAPEDVEVWDYKTLMKKQKELI